jgi:hypothetical protein
VAIAPEPAIELRRGDDAAETTDGDVFEASDVVASVEPEADIEVVQAESDHAGADQFATGQADTDQAEGEPVARPRRRRRAVSRPAGPPVAAEV